MIKKLLSMSTLAVFVLSVLLVTLVTTAGGAKDYMAEKSARNNGELVEIVLTEEDFQKESMRSRAPEKGWKATDGDPQLILNSQMKISYIEFYMEYIMYPGEMLVYYTTPEDTVYSNSKMVVVSPMEGKDGWFCASLPLTEISSLRIDPTSMAGNHLIFGDFVINPEKTLADYIAPDAYTVLSTAIYSLVLFAIFSFVKDFFTKEGK